MSDEQVKGIPEDLREHYEECGKYQNAHLILCRQLIERIARSEQALVALEAERDEARALIATGDGSCDRCGVVPSVVMPTSLCDECVDGIKRASKAESALAALEARNAELKAALRRLIGACVRPNGMLQPPDVDSEYAARAALKGAS